MGNRQISAKASHPSKYVEVLGTKMHYVEVGSGSPILFLHGIPTSSYLWRNVIPFVATLGRCIAPDLVGLGKSGKPDITYSIFDHIRYINEFIKALNLKDITFVLHGWGSIVGFKYTVDHPKNVKGLVFYESFLRSINGADISLPFQEQMLNLQELDVDFELGMDGANFVEKMLSSHVMRQLSEEEMENYREPFLEAGTHRPILQYLKEIPKANDESDVVQLIADYSKKLTKLKIPKLMLYSVPGFVTTIATIIWAKEHLPNLEVVDIGEEFHLGQESNPELIGETISVWLQGIEYVSI